VYRWSQLTLTRRATPWPYYQWSRAVAGKTVSRRLNEPQAKLYRDWIANRQRIETIITKMEETSAAAAAELLLREQRSSVPPRQAEQQPPEVGDETLGEKRGTSVMTAT